METRSEKNNAILNREQRTATDEMVDVLESEVPSSKPPLMEEGKDGEKKPTGENNERRTLVGWRWSQNTERVHRRQ
ncbi:hypothetical protein CCR75_009139 [Bremia lactucae]|uniref:Uncharacterized protein n=1 Tax=Bremia lactucae TaxID=4779 RepID=A0A976IM56_BRELC|nr:hypothetical protein CCR75_009477 [Bremia lactucae]TDH67165.1 hypothetical protein CCR75_009366 [Bremia lactucae]TDH68596.1 hypothetical protein CCR75_003586 [Bremia lactucae]TDH71317.1 hypothetical protein CCR75_005742 [Bremia lactucae]TDH71354.1 hypothetical protein CCR75_008359 [Bremia lactucae]